MNAHLDKALDAFRRVVDAPVAAFFSSCVSCGLCAETCLFYTETKDPRFTPIYKLEPMRRYWQQHSTVMGRVAYWLGLSKPLDMEELAAWSPLVYDSCTMCARCSMVCPAGNDIAGMVRKMREGMALAGVAPDSLVEVTKRALTMGSPMGVKKETLLAQLAAQERETGLKIPVDVEGAEYMVLLSGTEIMQFSDIIGALARIFKHAGVSWTISTKAFDATNSGVQLGVSEVAREIVLRVVTEAERLRVKTVISPECGHGYIALRWDGPNLIGRPYSFQVLHIIEVLAGLQKEGRLRLKQRDKDARPLCFHDPCQIARRGGVLEEPRALLKAISEEFRETADNRQRNWCCGGGGGVSAIERAEPLREKAFRKKLSQIEELGVHTLVTACANCRMIIEAGLESYQVQVDVVGLTEMVAEHLDEQATRVQVGGDS